MIYVVDDHAHSADFLARLLRKVGYPASVYASATEVLAVLEGDPPPSLLILDVMMPGMDGVACLRRVRERLAADRLPVVMYSADAAHATVQAAKAAGAQAFVVKATTPWEDFLSVIRNLAGDHRPTRT